MECAVRFMRKRAVAAALCIPEHGMARPARLRAAAVQHGCVPAFAKLFGKLGRRVQKQQEEHLIRRVNARCEQLAAVDRFARQQVVPLVKAPVFCLDRHRQQPVPAFTQAALRRQTDAWPERTHEFPVAAVTQIVAHAKHPH